VDMPITYIILVVMTILEEDFKQIYQATTLHS